GTSAFLILKFFLFCHTPVCRTPNVSNALHFEPDCLLKKHNPTYFNNPWPYKRKHAAAGEPAVVSFTSRSEYPAQAVIPYCNLSYSSAVAYRLSRHPIRFLFLLPFLSPLQML